MIYSFLIQHYTPQQLTELDIKPTGQYSSRIWFLIEWITGEKIEEKKDLTRKSYIPLIDEKLQYVVDGEKSSRHLVINNLPGTPAFCPLIRKTNKLERYLQANFLEQNNGILSKQAKEKDFNSLTENEIVQIESRFKEILN